MQKKYCGSSSIVFKLNSVSNGQKKELRSVKIEQKIERN
jgi:hypothetical protein